MEIPFVDLSKPENIVKEVFDDDRWVKDEFSNRLATEILEFSKSLTASRVHLLQVSFKEFWMISLFQRSY